MQIISITPPRRTVHLDIGDCPITTMIDFDGNETEDDEEAVVVIAKLSAMAWITIDLRRFFTPTLH